MDGDLIYIFEGITRQQGMRAIGTVVQMAGSVSPGPTRGS